MGLEKMEEEGEVVKRRIVVMIVESFLVLELSVV